MALDLADVVGRISREPTDDSSLEVYRVERDHPAFAYLSHMSMTIEAMTRTVALLKGRELPEDGHMGLAAVGFSSTFRVELESLVDAAISEVQPDSLWAPIVWRPHSTSHLNWASALRPWLRYTLRVGFIDIYELNKKAVNKYGGEAGRLARVVRDSSAHGGLIQSNTLVTPVQFHGIEIQRQLHGTPLQDVFDFGDYLILSLAMFGSGRRL